MVAPAAADWVARFDSIANALYHRCGERVRQQLSFCNLISTPGHGS
jgi:hypothetical protein